LAPRQLIVLTGLTGCGKTELLWQLRRCGEQTIDLEGLAQHAGSAFGGIGRSPQPAHHAFQALVMREWSSAQPDRPLWLEDEAPFIGSVGLPPELLNRCRRAPVVEVRACLGDRIARIARDYAGVSLVAFEAALARSRHRLGSQRTKMARKAMRSGKRDAAIEILLDYYDAGYLHREAGAARPVLATFDHRTDSAVELSSRLTEVNRSAAAGSIRSACP
jgi:tRNA 2-selenouridine synthase